MNETLSDKILGLRRYLNRNGVMEYWEGDTPKNKGIYVDLGAVMGNLEEAIKELKEDFGEFFINGKLRKCYQESLSLTEMLIRIDKIFGDKLIEGGKECLMGG